MQQILSMKIYYEVQNTFSTSSQQWVIATGLPALNVSCCVSLTYFILTSKAKDIWRMYISAFKTIVKMNFHG